MGKTTLTIRISDKEKKKIDNMASDLNVSTSEFIRMKVLGKNKIYKLYLDLFIKRLKKSMTINLLQRIFYMIIGLI